MRGKTILITGASRGIGRATALALAEQRASLILVCRDQERGNAVAGEVRERGGEADLVLADFKVMGQVRLAAEEVKSRHPRIDVLVNNAAAVLPERRVTPEGVEETFAVNHLAHFVLTVELLGVLEASAPSRIINLVSDAHRRGWMRWHDLHFKSEYLPMRAYAQSKLANILFTLELTRRLAGTGVTACSLAPGEVDTGLEQVDDGWKEKLVRLIRPRISAEEAARSVVRLALDPSLEKVTGVYWEGSRASRPSGYGRDDGLARRLWTTSEKLLMPRNEDSQRALGA
jgi:NAD(P)-dependent dehydrogenase (short-subunit alcohol dehydrogenase family)